MRKIHWLVLLAVMAIAASGCGKPAGTGETSSSTAQVANTAAKLDGPAEAAGEFLEALRTGNDDKAAQMLTALAREKNASLNRKVRPPASDTAKFTVGKVDYVDENGARVTCAWTDLDEEGKPKTDQAIWVLRREPEGWRVAGVAMEMPPVERPLVLNFEDPEDMTKQYQWFSEEMRRRLESNDLQAKEGEKTKNSVVR